MLEIMQIFPSLPKQSLNFNVIIEVYKVYKYVRVFCMHANDRVLL